MAKATATCTCATCGKKFQRSCTKYNRREADEWAAWAVENINECPDCAAARKDRQDADMGLPELTGSDKQIAWAKKIRRQMVETFQRAEGRARLDASASGDIDGWAASCWSVFRAVRESKKYIDAQTAGTYWIDFVRQNRGEVEE